ncbi:hypothetical protein HZ326_29078, partial [Fusarium oxysporum f. sp. albedinis]
MVYECWLAIAEDRLIRMPQAEQRDRRRKAALYSVHTGLITVSQNNRWKPCVAEFIQGPEPVQG